LYVSSIFLARSFFYCYNNKQHNHKYTGKQKHCSHPFICPFSSISCYLELLSGSLNILFSSIHVLLNFLRLFLLALYLSSSLFIYLLCPRRRILLRCILPFRLRNRWHAEHGTSSFCCFLSSSSLHPLHFWLTLVLLSAERRRCVGENLQPRHYYCDRK